MSEEATTHDTVLIAAFEGWNDACQAATNVVRHLVKQYESREVRHIEGDGFYDYQVARPMVCHASGRANIVWPSTTVFEITLPSRGRLYALLAAEPNYRWQEYCREVMRLAEELDVTRIITLGSMFSDCPHTRPLPLDVSDNSHQCECDHAYNGPVGIPTVLDIQADHEGFAHTSMWVSIPQYLSGDECAAATLRLLHGLDDLLEANFIEGDLPSKSDHWKAKASILIRCNDQLQDYVRHLEHEYDLERTADEVAAPGAPQAEQLVQEAEAFLRKIQ